MVPSPAPLFVCLFVDHEEHEGHEEGTKYLSLGFLPFVLFVSFVVKRREQSACPFV
jgi:hypothetical protein